MTIELPELYPKKQEILEIITRYLAENDMGYIKVPTGWGKTFLAKHIMNKYYSDGKAILFIVSRNNQLLDQIYYTDIAQKIPLFPTSYALSSNHDSVHKDELICKKEGGNGFIIFASLQTINSKKNNDLKDWLCKNIDLLIIDEVHNFINNQGNEFIDAMEVNGTKVFGMTATPFQGVIGKLKFVDDISGDMNEIYSKTLPQCIMENELSALNYSVIRNEQNILDIFDFTNGLSELSKDGLELDFGTDDKIRMIEERTRLAKKVYDEKIKQNETKTLVFCARSRNIILNADNTSKDTTAFYAKLCSAIFNNELINHFNPSVSLNNYSDSGGFKDAVYISSDLPSDEKSEILDSFRKNNSPPFVLCAVDMLIEGFDFPALENLMLLRPTLSMRLFEQQVGRVMRISENKKCANIFEVVDDIDSLHDTFGEQVFNEKVIDRMQLLQPENRIEQLLTDDGDNRDALEVGKINILDIIFEGNSIDKFQEQPIQIPPTSLKMKNFKKLLDNVAKKDMGKLKKETAAILKSVLWFKIYNIDDVKEISKLIDLLDKLEQDAKIDPQLSGPCSISKPKLFNEARYLLKLKVLTDLKSRSNNLNSIDKNEALEILGYDANWDDIDKYREDCLRIGCLNSELDTLIQRMTNVVITFKKHDFNSPIFKRLKNRFIMDFRHDFYWASCFLRDNPDMNNLFESKGLNELAKKYIK